MLHPVLLVAIRCPEGALDGVVLFATRVARLTPESEFIFQATSPRWGAPDFVAHLAMHQGVVFWRIFLFRLCLETKATWLHSYRQGITSAGTSMA